MKSFHEDLVYYICHDLQPFSAVRDKGFVRIVRRLYPRVKLPSRSLLTNEIIPKAYGREKNKLIEQLSHADAVALTTDFWSSTSQQSYAGLPLENFRLPCQAIQNMATLPRFESSHEIAMFFSILPRFCSKITPNFRGFFATVPLKIVKLPRNMAIATSVATLGPRART